MLYLNLLDITWEFICRNIYYAMLRHYSLYGNIKIIVITTLIMSLSVKKYNYAILSPDMIIMSVMQNNYNRFQYILAMKVWLSLERKEHV